MTAVRSGATAARDLIEIEQRPYRPKVVAGRWMTGILPLRRLHEQYGLQGAMHHETGYFSTSVA
jgi:hypothetical protein